MSARTQPRPISTGRRLSHVQVPSSPYRTPSSTRVMQTPTAPQNGSDQENTPLPKQRVSVSPTKSASTSGVQLKRKRSEHDLSHSQTCDLASASSEPQLKKPKLNVDMTSKSKFSPSKKTGTSKSAALTTGEDPHNASEEFPDGSFYCHQCARKKDVKGQCPVFIFFAHVLRYFVVCQMAFSVPWALRRAAAKGAIANAASLTGTISTWTTSSRMVLLLVRRST